MRARRVGSLAWFHLEEGEIPRRADRIGELAVRRFNAAYHALVDAGLYLPPSAYELVFLCTAHTPGQVGDMVRQVARAAEM